MSLSPGKLRHVITFQRRVKGQDSFGAMKDGWEDVFINVPAAVEPVSARDYIASSETQYPVSARITVRYRPRVDPAMRIIFRGNTYSISGILADKVSGLEYLTILVTEGVGDN